MKGHLKSMLPCWVAFHWLVTAILYRDVDTLSVKDRSNKRIGLSRQEVLWWPIGIGSAVVYGKLVTDTYQKLSRGDLVYPEAHERRVSSTIELALLSSIPTSSPNGLPTTKRPLRVLEVGIGKEGRLIRRDLYRSAYQQVASTGEISQIDLVGVDIVIPSEVTSQTCKDALQKLDNDTGLHTDFRLIRGSISKSLDIPEGYFDCILCSLTLCSVDDQVGAVEQIQRLLRPDGGCFGYVEHTAVLPDEPYHFLEIQQKAFDPLQQLLAGNCHLHRYTDATISQVFGTDTIRSLSSERFLVEGMWPVSCQACGVIQRILC